MDFSSLLPEHYPSIVYKYRDWSNDYHKRTLLNGELFLASPLSFNDPIDCKVPIAYYKLAEDPVLALKYFEEFVERQFPAATKSQKQTEVEHLINEGNFYKPDWIKWQEQKQFDDIGKAYGIISFSQHKNKMLLWAHYAASHTGFCIGFNSNELFFNKRQFGSGGKVIYEREMPLILPTDNIHEQIIKQVYVKSDIWEYEDEYRVTKFQGANQIVEFGSKELAEIIIGTSMKKADVDSVLNICKCNFPDIPIYKTIVVPRTFNLDFVQLN